MAGAQDGALAMSISNPGGLGSLPCAMLSSETMPGRPADDLLLQSERGPVHQAP
jgi:hypothetical protein